MLSFVSAPSTCEPPDWLTQPLSIMPLQATHKSNLVISHYLQQQDGKRAN